MGWNEGQKTIRYDENEFKARYYHNGLVYAQINGYLLSRMSDGGPNLTPIGEFRYMKYDGFFETEKDRFHAVFIFTSGNLTREGFGLIMSDENGEIVPVEESTYTYTLMHSVRITNIKI